MKKEIISTQEGTFLVIILILGTSLILTGGGRASQDVWVAILLGILAVIPATLIYGKIISIFPGKNLYEILEISFGKIIGKIISALYILYFIYLGILCIRNITEFVQIASFPETPQYFTALCITILSIYMVKSGIEVLGRWTKLVSIFLFCLIFFITLTAIPKFDYENLRPMLYEGWKPIFHSTFILIAFPFGELVLFLSLFHTLKDHKKAIRVLLIGLIIGGLILLITALRNMFLLGLPILTKIYFPTYYANSLISIGGFFQRMEIVAAITLILAGFAKCCICLFAISIGVGQLFNASEYGSFSIPMGLIMMVLSMIIYENTMEMLEGIELYAYIALPFQMILPPIILLFAWRKKRSQGNNP